MSEKISLRKLKNQYTPTNLLPGDSINIKNDSKLPYTIWIERRKYSKIGKIVNAFNNLFRKE